MTRLIGLSRAKGLAATITGSRVYLRPPHRRDRDAWIRLRTISRAFLEPWEPSWAEDALSKSAYRRRLRRAVQDQEQDLGCAFFIFHRESDELLGGISLSRVQRGVAQSCSLGYWIGEPYARQGYMTEALRGLLTDCFGPLGFHRIEAACLPDNESSRRLLEKCGFRREGYAHEYLRINGRWHDHLLYALIEKDFRKEDAPSA